MQDSVGRRIAMRAALYLRVSTTDQTTENQERELRAAADRLGHVIVEVYRDHGISGGKGREKRPAFDKLHRDATLRKFDLVMAWSVDRLGRSLQDLVHFLDHLRSTRVELFLHQQGLDTTSPAGRAMFGMLSVFSEFERAIIQERIAAGMARAKANGTKSGKPIGRPRIAAPIKDRIRAAHRTGGASLRDLAAQFRVGRETVRRVLYGGD
jgi:DNA invertase Pin-like site-specific DNA recombinase